MSWDLLQRFFDSEVFNQNPFLSVSYLTYALLPLRSYLEETPSSLLFLIQLDR